MSTSTIWDLIILAGYMLAAFLLYNHRKKTSIKRKVEDLANASRKTGSPIVVIMHNKEEDRHIFTMIGDRYEIIREITDATDMDPDAEEFMQIISNFYNSKTVTR